MSQSNDNQHFLPSNENSEMDTFATNGSPTTERSADEPSEQSIILASPTASITAAEEADRHAANETPPDQPVTFLTIPRELRNLIYKLVDPRIELWNYYQAGASGGDSGCSASRSRTNTEEDWHDQILRVCRQIRAETSEMPLMPRIIIGGNRGGLLNGGHGLASEYAFNLDTLELVDRYFASLGESREDWYFAFFKPGRCPNLKFIEFTPERPHWDGRPHDPNRIENIQLPAPILPTIQDWMETHVGKQITGLLPLFKAAASTLDSWYSITPVQETDAFIKERRLVVSTSYKIGLRGTELTWPHGDGRRVLFEGRFNVTLIWDESGVRIKDLPDLGSMVWWSEWIESGDVASCDQFEIQILDVEISDGEHVGINCEVDLGRVSVGESAAQGGKMDGFDYHIGWLWA